MGGQGRRRAMKDLTEPGGWLESFWLPEMIGVGWRKRRIILVCMGDMIVVVEVFGKKIGPWIL